ncbi:MAG TPA: Asp23/Gls24 family envelope stress response protein [Anaerolineales bacterium]|nr:Asp23/Gls24 family envelope stress response protein [Anaerolineales bacterium]
MSKEPLPYGSTHISPRAIATIAFNATMESYGVVGLASKNLLDGLANVIVNDPTHGIDVHFDEDRFNIDLYIIVEYGTRIKSVAANVAKTVQYRVEKAVGLPVNTINVHVQGLRFNSGAANG